MPKNKYFNSYTDIPQQTLYKGLIDECLNFYGIDTTYIPRTSLSTEDLLFGDDPTKAFQGSYGMTTMIMNVDSFEGGDMFSKFGLIINKSVKVLLGNTEFQNSTGGEVGSRPREGDLIYLFPFQALYEIKYVNQDKFFYAFGNKQFYGWELDCEEFRYNNELIETGIEEIDVKVDSVVTAYQAWVNLPGSNTYSIGETVYQGPSLNSATALAIVVSWNLPTGNLVLKNTAGIFTSNANLIGASSNAIFTLSSIENEQNVNESLDNNVLIRTEANTDLDISEENPLQGNPILNQSEED